MKRVLVTGGHGFVGSHLVRRLLASGSTVRCLVRAGGLPESLRGLPVQVVQGDLTRAETLGPALIGIEEVFHLAARLTAASRREMFETNATGTRRLLEATSAAGTVERFVYCSTLAVCGASGLGAATTEEAPHAPVTWYGASKALAERIVSTFGSRGLPVTIVRPPIVYGPRDRGLLSVFQSVARGWKPLLGRQPKRYSWIYAEDLAEALVVLGRSPATAGKTYLATHPEIVEMETFLDLVASALARSARPIRVPDALLGLVAGAADLVAQVTGRPGMLTRDKMAELVPRGWVCSSEAATRDAGWTARTTLASGVPPTVAWYRENGWI